MSHGGAKRDPLLPYLVMVGLLNPVTVGLKETLCHFRLEHTHGHSGAKRVPLLPYPVTVGLGGSKRDPRVPHPVTVGLLRLH